MRTRPNSMRHSQSSERSPIRGKQIDICPVEGSPSYYPDKQHIHYRARNGLKPLNPDMPAWFLFPAQEAMFDRLQMTVSFHGHCQDIDAYHRMIAHLGSWDGACSPGQSQLFRFDQIGGAQDTNRIAIEKGWLFRSAGFRNGGRVFFDRRHSRVHFHLTLVLNPTRFLAHQPTNSIPDIAQRSPEAALRQSGTPRLHRSLDGKDNVLLLDQRGGRSFDHRDERWAATLDVYLTQIRNLFEARLRELHSDDIDSVSNIQFEAVQQAEVYWELEAADALTDLAALRNAVLAIAPASRTSYCYTVGFDKDAPFIKIALTENIELEVYAKERKIVRFEVKYKAPIRQIAGRIDASSSSPLSDLLVLRHDARRRIQIIWKEIATMISDVRGAGDLFDFIERLRRAKIGEDGSNLISILGNNRRITDAAVGAATLKALVREGILEPKSSVRHGGAKCYPLSRPWSAMFDQLLNRTDCPSPLTSQH